MSTPMLAAAKRGFREIQGVVVSAGLMDRTVKVRVGGRVWNDQIKKVREESICSRSQPTC
ncbi:mitochondrial 37S ribosomal protein S17 [Magnaporthiopsis poae ATCC 64411]|uniref:Mitochondrial 37S ribosomal protein S17 n=1 Tax=Magnaporthiopsis poae (strain ATCC 64411 / 73-15) TaxID=644358 RepID=A0A0C4DUJ0_MAGP6|nr:mitochondrial 37S ribosomal protein S17 [Magnaporthiopsis poae ATCC 64411]